MQYYGNVNVDVSNGNGFVSGPSFTQMTSTTITGTAGYNSNYAIYPNQMPIAYNNNAGATRMIVFSKDTGGSSAGGITSSSSWTWARLSGGNLTPTNMRNIWTAMPTVAGQYTANYQVQSSQNLRASAGSSGVVYIPGGHGTSGGVYQWVSGSSSTVNTNLVFEYKPVGQAANSAYTDPNHYWMVESGETSAVYFRSNNQYGNNVAQPNAATGVLASRYGGIAVY